MSPRTAIRTTTLLVALAGCEGEGSLPAMGPPKPPPTPPAEDAGVPPPPPPPGPRVRTVEVRGWAGTAGNLLVDGDFELSGVGDGQAGWIAVGPDGQVPFDVETGGLCKSGLRCAQMKRDLAFFARGTAAPAGKRHLATLWAKPPLGSDCTVVTVQLLTCDAFTFIGKLKRDDDLPDASGWCRYQADVAKQPRAVCMYVDNQLGSSTDVVLLDAAVLAPNDGTVALQGFASEPQTAAEAARVAAAADFIRRGQRFGLDKVEEAAKRDRRRD